MNATLRFYAWLRRGLVASVDETGTIDASVIVNGVAVPQTLQLRGPGDVVGISSVQIVRREPPDGTTDFEPNYFPTIDLATPDLPWMFTHATARGDRLTPWLVLVVVRDQEGVSLSARSNAPLPVLAIDAPARATDELPDLAEAWAWSHVQASIDPGAEWTALDEQPGAFVARLVCPRRLAPSTRYIACVVPSFAQGVRAGLGLAVDGTDPRTPAWSSDDHSIELPVYASWRFRTGVSGDFEALVRALVPRELGSDVGVRDLDVGEPGGGLPSSPGARVSYLGALTSPSAAARTWNDPHRTDVQTALRSLLAASVPGGEPDPYVPLVHDPVVGVPAYGLTPSGEATADATAWLADVNLDPAQRAVAGLGAEAVREHQEELMAEAWDQARPLRRINHVLARSRLAAEVGKRYATKLGALRDAALVQVAGPALARLPDSEHGTLASRVAATDLPKGTASAAFRRTMRRGGTVARSLGTLARTSDPTAKVTARIAAHPEAMLAFTSLVRPAGLSITQPISLSAARTTMTVTAARSARPMMFEEPLIVEHAPVATSTTSLAVTAAAIRAALDPIATISARLRSTITAPASAWTSAVPQRMNADPVLDASGFTMLRRLGVEYLVPGLSQVPLHTVGVLVPNARFIEAFLLGANHELARELVWREYPTDPASTWLRRFWDAPTASEDIPPISAWSSSPLGTHLSGAAASVALVLLIRGPLIRRYPDARIYAVPAVTSGATRSEDTSATPLDPIVSGRIDPDTAYYGFELSVEKALAGAGWFAVFEENPSGPRFGLDVERSEHAGRTPTLWTDLSWAHLVDNVSELDTLAHVSVAGRLDGQRKAYDTDEFVETWGVDAAAMARITYQRPTRMLVHMSALLPEET